ncbi:hypothetical protein NQZ68_040497 [Dissostichus eleginoides]|nr:hypothetical protein NQZ68_040497 [Dissostichus eleginoides]
MPEAVHLGDLLRIWGQRELTGRRRNRDAFQGTGPSLGANPFQGALPFTKKRELSPGPSFTGIICTRGGSTRAHALGFRAHRGGPPTRCGVALAAPVASNGRVWARRSSAIHFQG